MSQTPRSIRLFSAAEVNDGANDLSVADRTGRLIHDMEHALNVLTELMTRTESVRVHDILEDACYEIARLADALSSDQAA